MEAIEKLRLWREESVRDPEAVRDLWKDVDKIESKLTIEEKWTVIEQFCLAAFDLHDDDIYTICLDRLNKQFPGSNRVRLLNIIAECELEGNYDEAIRQYNEMLEDDETNTSARKRKIAILICQRKNVEAIRELCEYLKKFMNDQEAWKELCDLYVQEQDYHKAIFCMEDSLMSNPLSHVYYIRLAELHYTIGTFESFELARAYYQQAIRLNENSARALHGLCLTLKYLLASNKLSSQVRKEYEKLAISTKTNLNQLYARDGHPEIVKYMEVK